MDGFSIQDMQCFLSTQYKQGATGALYPLIEMFRSSIQGLFVHPLTQMFLGPVIKLTLIVIKPHFNKPVMLEWNKNWVTLKSGILHDSAKLIESSSKNSL